jgi:hypothetical protein
MLVNLVSSCTRWVGQSWQMQGPEPDQTESRVWLRVPSNVQAMCHPAGGKETGRFAAQVQNISRGGINLLAARPLETGSLLCVELPGEDGDCTCDILAYVIRVVAKANGDCILGCAFATELRDEELRPFEAKRIRPMSPDPRRWVRFPCAAQFSFRSAAAPESDEQTAQAVDISPRGVGFHLPYSLEVGSLLSLQFRPADGQLGLTILASVVRCATLGGSDWLIGCNFIRELTEEELRSVE